MISSLASAGDTNVEWLGHADGCDYQYANVDGIVTEKVIECTTEWLYPNRPANQTRVHVNQARIYDLRLQMVCTMSGYQVTGISMCRSVEELRALDSPFSAELIRRFEWLEAWMSQTETNPAPRLEEFDACVEAQGG